MSTSDGSESFDSMDEDISQLPRTRRSKVWEHYEKDLVLVDDDLKAVCLYCGAQLQTKFGTSSLRSHTAESCRLIEDSCRKRFLSTMKSKPEPCFVFDPKVCRELMIKFCIHAEIPFLKFEDPYLQPWIDSMQPSFQLIGRHTIRSDAKKMYEGMKKDIEVELQNLDSRISLTSDMWTSSQSLGYMSITAHYINEEFNYKKKIISFKELKYPHNGYAIEEAVVGCLTEWGIRGKWVRKYVKEYELQAATSTASSTPPSQGNTTIGSPIAGKRKLEEEFAQHKSRRRSRVHKSELETYLEEACEEDTLDFDVLAWWKKHAVKFPILSSMARDFLAIPLSTVASESAFSCGGRILGDTRSSLTPDMLQALVCAKDWLYIPKGDEGQGQ